MLYVLVNISQYFATVYSPWVGAASFMLQGAPRRVITDMRYFQPKDISRNEGDSRWRMSSLLIQYLLSSDPCDSIHWSEICFLFSGTCRILPSWPSCCCCTDLHVWRVLVVLVARSGSSWWLSCALNSVCVDGLPPFYTKHKKKNVKKHKGSLKKDKSANLLTLTKASMISNTV